MESERRYCPWWSKRSPLTESLIRSTNFASGNSSAIPFPIRGNQRGSIAFAMLIGSWRMVFSSQIDMQQGAADHARNRRRRVWIQLQRMREVGSGLREAELQRTNTTAHDLSVEVPARRKRSRTTARSPPSQKTPLPSPREVLALNSCSTVDQPLHSPIAPAPRGLSRRRRRLSLK